MILDLYVCPMCGRAALLNPPTRRAQLWPRCCVDQEPLSLVGRTTLAAGPAVG